MSKIPATSTLRKLLDTIDQLDAMRDSLNLEDNDLLCTQQDDLPYGAVTNALKVCVATLLSPVPAEPVEYPHASGCGIHQTLAFRFRVLLEDRSAIGALRLLSEDVEALYEDASERLYAAREESDHQDTCDDLRDEAGCWFRVYGAVRNLTIAANDING